MDQQSGFAALALGVTLTLAAHGCAPTSAGDLSSTSATETLGLFEGASADGRSLDGSVLHLRELIQGQRRNVAICLRNNADRVVRIAGSSTSCECVELAGLPEEIAPGAAVPLVLQVDLVQEASFVGELGLEIRVFAVEVEAISLNVRFEVKPLANEEMESD